MPKLDTLLKEIRACTVCSHATHPLPVTPNPILTATAHSRIRIIGQAPGTLAHQSSRPFDDPSGRRLRDWLGVNDATFYDANNFAITPMGFCFPGNDDKGGDLPPRPECAPLWQEKITEALPDCSLTLIIGMYAQKRYLGKDAHRTLTDTVAHWREYGPNIIPMPHPSWRNNGWIKRHEWFAELLEYLKERVDDVVQRR